ncbi:MAG: NADH:flavin oxidoreductase [Candidatus Aureabacteria bacterium]|nr:NADH:flavin oxidoreductase [Candidatus Auribacterota bacterium]
MLFNEWKLKNITSKNRLVRSATYEGMGDINGNPLKGLKDIYKDLATNDVGMIITGFCFISQEGRAMQPHQCGIDSDDKIDYWKDIVSYVKSISMETLLVMQIAHAGRQTLKKVTGLPVVSPSTKRSLYFKEKPVALNDEKIKQIINEFGDAAKRAQKAGFDGIQIHAAHGYLIHQFLSPHINKRNDRWGKNRSEFLRETILNIKDKCGNSFPVFVKISAADDDKYGLKIENTFDYIKKLENVGIEAFEISYGTMDAAFNIFRGTVPIQKVFEHNILFKNYNLLKRKFWQYFIFPQWKKGFITYKDNYNLPFAKEIKRNTNIPIILVGGLREKKVMDDILRNDHADAISLSRPLICEPDLGKKLKENINVRSICRNCNECIVMCDSENSLNCYGKAL